MTLDTGIQGCGRYDEKNPHLARSCGDILFNKTIYLCADCKFKKKVQKEKMKNAI